MGVVLLPYSAQASFFSDLFGTNASADTIETISAPTDNSQNISLLEANISSASIVDDKKKDTKENTNEVKEDAQVTITNNALTPTTSLQSGEEEVLNGESFSDQVSTYVIRKGDSMPAIAKMFGVSVNTIYWANDLKKGDKLKEGDTLVILPFDGLTHTVKSKETLAGIAKLYKADIDDIMAFNGMNKGDKLVVGDEIIIPEGQKTEESDKPVKKSTTTVVKNTTPSKNLKSVDGYFIYPLPTGPRIRKTQGIHDRYAVDIGAPSGTPIYAAAAGKVVVARNGYNGGYGNLVIVQHPNGTETRYAHMSKLGTTSGKQVSQGEVIGYVGTTGRSTGNHLHIEVRGARNPFQ